MKSQGMTDEVCGKNSEKRQCLYIYVETQMLFQ